MNDTSKPLLVACISLGDKPSSMHAYKVFEGGKTNR